ncbi:stress-induced-phosphoprotein 1, partial [Aphelenchoides avenae]
LFELAAGARIKQADIPPNVQQLEEKPEQLSYLKDAIQFYGQSVANYAHDAVERKHKFYADKLRDVYVNPGRAQEAEKRGNEFFKDEDYEKAVEQYDEAVRRDPGNAQLHLTRAWCHLKRTPMRCAKAIADCKTAIDLDPSN